MSVQAAASVEDVLETVAKYSLCVLGEHRHIPVNDLLLLTQINTIRSNWSFFKAPDCWIKTCRHLLIHMLM